MPNVSEDAAPFTPSRLTVARKRRGLTKAALATKVGVSVRSISAYEKGQQVPTDSTIVALSKAVNFPSSFFSGTDLDEVPENGASFRSLSSLTAKQRDAALAAGSLALLFDDWIQERFRLPSPNLPNDLRGSDPESAAEAVRAFWGLGTSSISNMVHLLEAQGVRVFSLAEESHAVDAFSFWRSDIPYVFLNTQKSAERGRRDAAHELGHLVLHTGHDVPQGKAVEMEAEAFASAFLMPRSTVLARPLQSATLQTLIKEKKRWKVSVASLVRRLHDVGMISDWQYRSLYIEIGTLGYRKSEPETITRESSQVLSKLFSQLRNEGIGRVDIANELSIEPHDIDALMFGLSLTAMSGGGTSGRAHNQHNLRVIR